MAVFTVFNLCAAAAGAGAGVRLLTPGARANWVSQRLYRLALLMCWGMVALGGLSTGLAWGLWNGDRRFALFVLVPLVWLVVMGILFAVIDFAEDGVFDFGRGPRPKGS